MAPRANRIQASPFLPSLPPVALGDLGRVIFPGTTKVGHGLLSLADRDPANTRNTVTISGPSSYTRQPWRQRVGGLFAPTLVGRPARAFTGRGGILNPAKHA